MLRLTVRILTITLALVGLVTIAVWAWPTLRGAPSAPNNLTVIVSPDGRFKAARASWDGGGAISPFCYESVFVAPEAMPNDLVVDDKNLVFGGDCATFEDHSISPKVLWVGPRALSIKFQTTKSTIVPAKLRIQRLAVDGQVNVEFEVGH